MFYIIEHDIRPDGVVNVSETARQTFASALSYYYDRCSKMVMNESFVSVHLMLVDESLYVEKRDDIATLYTEETEE